MNSNGGILSEGGHGQFQRIWVSQQKLQCGAWGNSLQVIGQEGLRKDIVNAPQRPLELQGKTLWLNTPHSRTAGQREVNLKLCRKPPSMLTSTHSADDTHS